MQHNKTKKNKETNKNQIKTNKNIINNKNKDTQQKHK